MLRRLRTDTAGAKRSSDEGENPRDIFEGRSPELLLDALSHKISSLTMISRDEITINRSLLDYGLDSLFSLELRNWMRRTMDVDVALKDITTARDLQALTDRILSLKKSTISASMLSQNKALANTDTESELRPDSSRKSVEGEVSQLVPLSPFQRLLLSSGGFEEQVSKAKISFRYQLENLKVQVSASRVEGAIRKLISHHPMLRARFQRRNRDARLVHELSLTSQASFLFRLHTLKTPVQTGEDPDATARFISESAPDNMLVADLILFPGSSWIVFTSHSVLLDGVSWDIIRKDLEGLLMDASPKFSSDGSFARWVQSQGTHLSNSVGSKLPRADNGFWNLQTNRTSDRAVIEHRLWLDSDVTERLAGACNVPLNTKPVELLMTAVLLSFGKTFSDRDPPALYSQLDGREVEGTSPNTWARTVGCFTTLVPVVAAISSDAPVEEAVATVKDTYRAIMRDRPSAFASCMLGQDPLVPSDIEVLFSFKDEQTTATGTTIEEPQLVGLLRILAEYRERQLHFRISYSSGIAHQDRIITWIAELKTTALRLRSKETRLTWSEMPLHEVNDEERDSIQKHLRSIGIDVSNVESVLPCTPIQEGLLFRQLRSQRRLGWECMTLKITPRDATGCVDVEEVASAWKTLCIAQPMLRTVLTSSPSSAGAFQQIILKKTQPSVSFATVELQTGIKPILENVEGPDFATARPPHHLHVVQTSDSAVYAYFHLSHAIFDGRSLEIIGQQLRQAYRNSTGIPKGPDISRYVSWIRNHPKPAQDHWKAYLSGARPCLSSVLTSSESKLLDTGSPRFIDVVFDQPRQLQAFCRRQGVTLANLMQVSWGFVLRQCNGSRSVTFGCSQSQAGAIEGGEMTLGPLIADIPYRLDVGPETTPRELLQSARDDTLLTLELPSCSWGELQEASGLDVSSLFDTGITLTRIPAEISTPADEIRFERLHAEEISSEVGSSAHLKH